MGRFTEGIFEIRFFWVGNHNFTKIFENRFVATEPSRASQELMFYASGSCVRALSVAYAFVAQFAILRHEIAKHFHAPENTRLDTALLKMRFPLRFKHFSGSGKLLKYLLQRLIHINASRASWKLIFDALKSCDRWLFNAYRFVFQLVIFRRNGIKRIGAFFVSNILVKNCKNVLQKLTFLVP